MLNDLKMSKRKAHDFQRMNVNSANKKAQENALKDEKKKEQKCAEELRQHARNEHDIAQLTNIVKGCYIGLNSRQIYERANMVDDNAAQILDRLDRVHGVPAQLQRNPRNE